MVDRYEINGPDDIELKVRELGFLPFFSNAITGYSVEEHTPRHLWFSKEIDGPWEWKGPIVRRGECAYGKFFNNRAVYISQEWFPRFVNYRRSTSPLSYDEERVLTAITANESLLTTEIRDTCGFAPPKKVASLADLITEDDSMCISGRRPSLDSILTRLQMGCHIVVSDFEYKIDKRGRAYGWGVARYSTPEILYADWFQLPDEAPEASYRKILDHMHRLFPDVDAKKVDRMIKR